MLLHRIDDVLCAADVDGHQFLIVIGVDCHHARAVDADGFDTFFHGEEAVTVLLTAQIAFADLHAFRNIFHSRIALQDECAHPVAALKKL